MRPPLDVYDVLIHLNPKQVPLLSQAVDPPTVNFSRGVMAGATVAESGGALPVVDYNPVALYLAELRVSPGLGGRERRCRANGILSTFLSFCSHLKPERDCFFFCFFFWSSCCGVIWGGAAAHPCVHLNAKWYESSNVAQEKTSNLTKSRGVWSTKFSQTHIPLVWMGSPG